ncbi:MAG: hypothetical protein ABIB04_04275 [Patescibacteria group bacterium]
MSYEEMKIESKDEDKKKRDEEAELMRDYLKTKLDELNASDKITAEQVEALILFITQIDKDKPLVASEDDLNGLFSELRKFNGSDVASFAAQTLSFLFSKEGKYTDIKKYREKILARSLMRSGFKIFPDNFVFSYGVDEGGAHIHLSNPNEGEAKSVGSDVLVLRKFLSGLVQFAGEVVEKDDNIKIISATSTLLARPELARFLESLGFVNKGEMNEEERRAHFKNETEPVIKLEATRELFLAKMKNKNQQTLQKQMIKLIREAK